MLNKKERDHSVMLEYFLAQALKMKPLLWKKVWRGFQIRLNADKQGQSNKKEDPYKIQRAMILRLPLRCVDDCWKEIFVGE